MGKDLIEGKSPSKIERTSEREGWGWVGGGWIERERVLFHEGVGISGPTATKGTQTRR